MDFGYDLLAIGVAIPVGLGTGYVLIPLVMRRWPQVIIVNSARIIFLLAAVTSIPYTVAETIVGVPTAPNPAQSLERRIALGIAWVVFVTAMAWATRFWVRRHPGKP